VAAFSIADWLAWRCGASYFYPKIADEKVISSMFSKWLCHNVRENLDDDCTAQLAFAGRFQKSKRQKNECQK
jgi:hypothetical protein